MTADTTPRHLLVVGATPPVRHLLDALKPPGGSTYVDSAVDALPVLEDHPDALVAYGPAVFGPATTAQPVRLGAAQKSVAVLTDVPASGAATDDPESLIFQAAHALDVDYVVPLVSGAACLTLVALLERRVG